MQLKCLHDLSTTPVPVVERAFPRRVVHHALIAPEYALSDVVTVVIARDLNDLTSRHVQPDHLVSEDTTAGVSASLAVGSAA